MALRFHVVKRPALLKRLEVRLVRAIGRLQRANARRLGHEGALTGGAVCVWQYVRQQPPTHAAPPPPRARRPSGASTAPRCRCRRPPTTTSPPSSTASCASPARTSRTSTARDLGHAELRRALEHRPHVGAPGRPHEETVAVAGMAPCECFGGQDVRVAVAEGSGRSPQLRADEAWVFASALQLEVRADGEQVDARPVVRRVETREATVPGEPRGDGCPVGMYSL